MRKYKMIALVYNKLSESKGVVALEKVLDSTNGFLENGAKFIWCRKTTILQKLKEYTDNTKQENNVFVFRLKYHINHPAEHDLLLGSIYNFVKNTDNAVIVLLETQKEDTAFSLQDFQCEYGCDGGLEMFFDLLVAEEGTAENVEICILKNRCGELYTL